MHKLAWQILKQPIMAKLKSDPKFVIQHCDIYFSRLEINALRLCDRIYFTPILETDHTVVDKYTKSNN